MALAVTGRSLRRGLDLSISLFIVLRALRLECVKSALDGLFPSCTPVIIKPCDQGANSKIWCIASISVGSLEESFVFFIPVWYLQLFLATRNALFCSIDGHTAESLVCCVRITCIW